MAQDGASLAVLDGDGRVVRTLSAATGLIAATREGEEAPVWVVTGTDPAGVEAAAGAFDQASLERRFAVVMSGGRAQALPARALAAERSGA
jgi:3-polyprenyl-4-hydroxybenzoate decarboxylase